MTKTMSQGINAHENQVHTRVEHFEPYHLETHEPRPLAGHCKHARLLAPMRRLSHHDLAARFALCVSLRKHAALCAAHKRNVRNNAHAHTHGRRAVGSEGEAQGC